MKLVTLTWSDTATAASARTEAVTSPNPTASMNWLICVPSSSRADECAQDGDERHEAFHPAASACWICCGVRTSTEVEVPSVL
jgi:hypothetical protein